MTIPLSAFTPADELAQIAQGNPDWVDGYKSGMGMSGTVPGPKSTDTWFTYWASLAPMLMIAAVRGWVSNFGVGYNGAIQNAAVYIWHNDPNSPYLKAS
jgi:hypothetical protein